MPRDQCAGWVWLTEHRVSVEIAPEGTWPLNRSHWQVGDALVGRRCQAGRFSGEGSQHWLLGESVGPCNQIQTLDPPLSDSVTLGKLLSSFVHQLLHLQNCDNNNNNSIKFTGRIKWAHIRKACSRVPSTVPSHCCFCAELWGIDCV